VVVGHLCIFFGKMPGEIHCLFFNWCVCLKLSCNSSLYILDTGPLTDTWFSNISSISLSHILLFYDVLWNRKFEFWWCPIIFSFVVVSQKSLPDPRSWRFMPVSSSKTGFLNVDSSSEDFDLFWIKLDVWCEMMIRLNSLACGFPVIPTDNWLLIRKIEEAGGVGSTWDMSWWWMIALSVNM